LLTHLRRSNEEFRRETFLKGTALRGGVKDVTWLNARGSEMTGDDWHNQASRTLGIWFGNRSRSAGHFLLLLNADDCGHTVALPAAAAGNWVCRFDTALASMRPAAPPAPVQGETYPLGPNSAALLES
jgi:pullulanase/glycogen debranching enzyme